MAELEKILCTDSRVESVKKINAIIDNRELDGKLTNCITEIPQRIKLELANGVLTLKAGSEVIVPNGFEEDGTTPKFDYVTIESGVTYTRTSNNQALIYFNPNKNAIDGFALHMVTSGATPPTNITTTYWLWYDTANNLVKKTSNNGSTWESVGSLPIGLITVSNGAISSIDQTFNGMGYIGSTVWVDKGVKGLIPDGRNEDGTLRNIEYTSDRILMRTFDTPITGRVNLQLLLDGTLSYSYNYIVQSSIPSKPSSFDVGTLWLNTAENTMYRWITTTTSWDKAQNIVLLMGGWINLTEGVITSLQLKQTFRAIDYSDKPQISSWGMPSSKRYPLDLGASTSKYQAPANGWFTCACTGTTGSTYFEMVIGAIDFGVTASFTGGWGRACLPVRKGDVITVYYGGNNFKAQSFHFIYAQGEV